MLIGVQRLSYHDSQNSSTRNKERYSSKNGTNSLKAIQDDKTARPTLDWVDVHKYRASLPRFDFDLLGRSSKFFIKKFVARFIVFSEYHDKRKYENIGDRSEIKLPPSNMIREIGYNNKTLREEAKMKAEKQRKNSVNSKIDKIKSCKLRPFNVNKLNFNLLSTTLSFYPAMNIKPLKIYQARKYYETKKSSVMK